METYRKDLERQGDLDKRVGEVVTGEHILNIKKLILLLLVLYSIDIVKAFIIIPSFRIFVIRICTKFIKQ